MSELYTSEAILKRMLDYTEAGYDKSPGGFIYDVQKPMAMEAASYHTRLENLNDKHHADTAEGDDLDKYVKDFGVVRKEATFAHGQVTFHGEPGAVINIGDYVADENGLVYYTTEGGSLPESGSLTVNIVCASATENGNAEASKINKMPVTIKGILSVENSKALYGGSNRETDAELRRRFYSRMDYKNVPGSKPWYEAEALAVDGVGAAKCIPTHNGGGTVKIIVSDSDMQPADDELIARVEEHFSEPIVGANITVATIGTLNIDVSVKVIPGSGYNAEAAKKEFTQLCREYLNTIGLNGGTVVIKKIGMQLLSIDGIADYENLTINGSDKNIVISANDNRTPMLGGVTFA